MQGTLNEIDIRSIFQLVELGQRTGQLSIESLPMSAVARADWADSGTNDLDTADVVQRSSVWFVFFVNGQIVYATNRRSANLQRLQGYLRHYHLDQQLKDLQAPPAIATTNVPEYAYLWLLLEQHIITAEQSRHILKCMVEETIFDLLSLHQGFFFFKLSTPLSPQLTSYPITPLLLATSKKVQRWKQLLPHIQSPRQCPLIIYRDKLSEDLPAGAYQKLTHWANGQTSLRQLARYLNRDLVTLSKALHPYVQKGWIQMQNPDQEQIESQPTWEVSTIPRLPKILCIDDDLTIGKTVEAMLEPHGYRVQLVQKPLAAFETAFTTSPDLILCDIAMPQLDGNQICGMLRFSNRFRLTPIIMLTGREEFIDRVKATMVGATDYLTKPFGTQELLTLLEKYLPWQSLSSHSHTP
ncbi:MAG: response regulator [Limnothrix sp.]